MNVNNQNYQNLSAFQKPQTPLPPISIQPVPKPDPSQELSPEDRREKQVDTVDTLIEGKEATEAEKEAQRTFAVGVIDHQSKQTQVEIYLSVASDSNVDTKNDTINVLESLRDIQKQNNAVEAYATYQENQNSLINY